MNWTCEWCDQTLAATEPNYGRDEYGEAVCRYCITAWSE